MMFWFNRHNRLRDQLSAYIDGELDASAAKRLERHMAECGRCSQELEQLRATVAALQGLPAVQPPRSFTLSPERAALPLPPPVPSASPLAFGARIAAAGVAAALAIVLVVDLGDFGGDGVTDEATAPQMMRSETYDMELETDGAGATDGALDPTPVAPGAATDDAQGEPAADDEEPTFMRDAETPAAAPEEKTEQPEEEEPAATVFPSIGELERAVEDELRGDKGGGMDALTVIEIGLAFALGLLLAGSLFLTFAGRRR